MADPNEKRVDRLLRNAEFYRLGYVYAALRGYAIAYPVVPLPEPLDLDPNDPAGAKVLMVLIKQAGF